MADPLLWPLLCPTLETVLRQRTVFGGTVLQPHIYERHRVIKQTPRNYWDHLMHYLIKRATWLLLHCTRNHSQYWGLNNIPFIMAYILTKQYLSLKINCLLLLWVAVLIHAIDEQYFILSCFISLLLTALWPDLGNVYTVQHQLAVRVREMYRTWGQYFILSCNISFLLTGDRIVAPDLGDVYTFQHHAFARAWVKYLSCFCCGFNTTHIISDSSNCSRQGVSNWNLVERHLLHHFKWSQWQHKLSQETGTIPVHWEGVCNSSLHVVGAIDLWAKRHVQKKTITKVKCYEHSCYKHYNEYVQIKCCKWHSIKVSFTSWQLQYKQIS